MSAFKNIAALSTLFTFTSIGLAGDPPLIPCDVDYKQLANVNELGTVSLSKVYIEVIPPVGDLTYSCSYAFAARSFIHCRDQYDHFHSMYCPDFNCAFGATSAACDTAQDVWRCAREASACANCAEPSNSIPEISLVTWTAEGPCTNKNKDCDKCCWPSGFNFGLAGAAYVLDVEDEVEINVYATVTTPPGPVSNPEGLFCPLRYHAVIRRIVTPTGTIVSGNLVVTSCNGEDAVGAVWDSGTGTWIVDDSDMIPKGKSELQMWNGTIEHIGLDVNDDGRMNDADAAALKDESGTQMIASTSTVAGSLIATMST